MFTSRPERRRPALTMNIEFELVKLKKKKKTF